MARLAVSVAGAAVGGFFGGAAGARLGFMAGAMIGSYLFPANSNVVVEGSRLSDKTVSSSAYGAPISINYGTVRTSGNVIWSSGIREQRNSSTVSAGGKGGGGASQTNVTYTYFCSFAVAFGEGEADDVLRIWADSKLIYDKTGTGTLSADDLDFRFYPGSETQLPDSIIEDDVGEENCPAFRGITMIVFDDLPLANYGNRIPNITAEITYNKSSSYPWQEAVNLNNPISSFQVDQIGVDMDREYYYLLATTGIRKYDMRTMTELRSSLTADILADGGLAGSINTGYFVVDDEGFIHVRLGSSNLAPVVKIDPISMKEVARFGTSAIFGENNPLRLEAVIHMAPITVIGLKGPERYYTMQTLFEGRIAVLDENYEFIAGASSLVLADGLLDMEGIGAGCCSGQGCAYHMSDSGDTIHFYKVEVAAGANFQWVDYPDLWIQTGCTCEHLFDIVSTDIGGTGTLTATPPVYDAVDDSFFSIMTDGASTHFFVKMNESGLVLATELPYNLAYPANQPAGYLKHGRYAYAAGTITTLINTRDGSYTIQTGWPVTSDGAQYYNDRESSVIIIDRGDATTYKYWLDRGTGEGVTLASIVNDIVLRTGLTLGDFDVSELTDDTVLGYILTRQMTARTAITPLAEAYLFDGVEIDYSLDFRKRGRDAVLALTKDDLAYINAGKLMDEARVQEVELPEKVSVVYMEKETDYESGTQFAKRQVLPKPTMFSHNQVTKEYALVLTADAALQLAEILLYQSWVERSTYSTKLPWRYLALDPSDVITLTVDNTVYRTRLASVGFGVDMSLEVDSISEEQSAYTSKRTADTGLGFPVQSIANPVPSYLWFLDVPLLRDQDDPNGAYTLDYYTIGAARPADWSGCFVYRSLDTNSWAEQDRSYYDASFGYLNGALVDPDSPWVLDTVSEVEVYMENGELASCTYEELMNGANACVINGEVCGFMTVTQDAGGYYTLTNWLRGQRGTDYACSGHSTGERMVMLDTDSIRATTNTIDTIGTGLYYKGVSFGTLLEDATTTGLTPSGKALMPYSPVQLTAANDGSDNIDISWVRRTRLGGGLRDGTGDVPLAETSEAYEVDIYISGTVVRTISVADATTTTYTTTMQATDGYSIASGEIDIEVFQMSSVVGRGFGRREVLEV